MQTLNVGGITLEGYAEGGIRTSIGVPEIKTIFDTGTCIPTSSRYNSICITHGHSDHIGALTNVIARRNLQAKEKPPANVYVPSVIHEDLENVFYSWWKIAGGHGPKFPIKIHSFDPEWKMTFSPQNGYEIRSVKTYHRIPSQGYVVSRITKKLKDIYVGRPREDIIKAKSAGIEITEKTKSDILCIPGDTTIDFLLNEEAARKSRVLVHEVTIWSDRASSIEKTRRYGHTHYREMIEHCEKFEGDCLVLCHRSMKHSRKEVENVVKKDFPSSMKDKIYIFDGTRDRKTNNNP